MAIEIRQMVVKSNVIQRSNDDEESTHRDVLSESSKEEILAACRRMITEMLKEKKER